MATRTGKAGTPQIPPEWVAGLEAVRREIGGTGGSWGGRRRLSPVAAFLQENWDAVEAMRASLRMSHAEAAAWLTRCGFRKSDGGPLTETAVRKFHNNEARRRRPRRGPAGVAPALVVVQPVVAEIISVAEAARPASPPVPAAEPPTEPCAMGREAPPLRRPVEFRRAVPVPAGPPAGAGSTTTAAPAPTLRQGRPNPHALPPILD